MIRFVEHNEVDTNKWDKCVKRSINSTLMLFLVFRYCCFELNALILNDYEAVFPLPTRKKWGIQYAFTPFWSSAVGLDFSNKRRAR